MVSRVSVSIVVFTSVCLFAPLNEAKPQEEYAVSGQVFVEGGNTQDIVFKLGSGGEQTKIVVGNDGRFSTNLSWDKTYFLQFSKAGFVSKIIQFDTHIPSDKHKNEISPYDLQVRLFKAFVGVDSMYFKNPVAKIRFDKQQSDFDYDTDYSLAVKQRIDQMMKQKRVSSEVTKPKVITVTENPRKPIDVVVSPNVREIPTDFSKNEDKPVLAENDSPYVHPSSSAIPPLKGFYPQGRTIERFPLENKMVTRVIVKEGGRQRVFLMVKHKWGATYYFVDESPLTTRCVSQRVYERETLLSVNDMGR